MEYVGANLNTTAHFSLITLPEYKGSRIAKSSVTTIDPARVVGILSAHMYSLQRNSLIEDLSTAHPSAVRENGVRPLPFSYNSYSYPPLWMEIITLISNVSKTDSSSVSKLCLTYFNTYPAQLPN